jgi:hypothetical protein
LAFQFGRPNITWQGVAMGLWPLPIGNAGKGNLKWLLSPLPQHSGNNYFEVASAIIPILKLLFLVLATSMEM